MSIQRYKVKTGPPNKRWRYKVRWLDHEAEQHRSRVFLTKDEAQRFEAQLLTARLPGGSSQGRGDVTLAELMDEFWKHERAELSPNTQRTLLNWWNVHLDHAVYGISNRTLQELVDRPKILDDFVAALRSNTGPEAVKRTVDLLKRLLATAVRWRWIEHSPAEGIRLKARSGKGTRGRKVVLGPTQVEALRGHVAGAGATRRDATKVMNDLGLISVLAYSGLRPGEALFLRFEDVREDALMVQGAVALGEEKDTKTGHGRRAPLLPVVREELLNLKAARAAHDDDLIFPAAAGGGVWTEHDWRNWRRRVFTASCRAVAVQRADCRQLDRAVPYALRGSAASLLLRGGGARNPARVARQMGHSLRVLFSHYADEIEEFADAEPVDADTEIKRARASEIARADASADGQAA